MVSSMFGDITIFFAIFLLAALAGMISERAGMVNIALEGYMIIGALVFSMFGFFGNADKSNNWIQIVGILLAMIATALFSVLHSFASIRMKANHIVSGTAINILAAGLGLFFITIADGSDFVSSNFLKIAIADMPYLNIYILIALIVALIIGIYFTYTKTGLRHAAAGENPNAVAAAGINVIRYRYIAMAVSASIAGLAGAIYVVGGPASGIFRGDTGGWGFLALGIMIVGQWRTAYIFIAAVVFAVLFGFGTNITGLEWVGQWFKDNKELVRALPFVLSLGIMVAMAKYSRPPKAGGQIYDKSKR